MYKLSILIPTIPRREYFFNKLYNELAKQINYCVIKHPSLGEVELRYDNSLPYLEGGKRIGRKRNDLLKLAHGDYVCFMDDDDDISPSYVETLLRLCNDGSDIVCFNTIFKCDNYWTVLSMDLLNRKNEEAGPARMVKRTPWHICPIKRSIAQSESFNELNHNEDWDWMERVLRKCKTSIKTHEILTQYNHSERNSEADKILKHEASIN